MVATDALARYAAIFQLGDKSMGYLTPLGVFVMGGREERCDMRHSTSDDGPIKR